MTPSEIVEDYEPSITLADVHIALAYYYDHLEEIRQQMREDEAFVAEMIAKTPSLLRQKVKNHNAGKN